MALNDAIENENDNSSEKKTDNENSSDFAMDCGRDAGGNQSLEPCRDNLQSPESSERDPRFYRFSLCWILQKHQKKRHEFRV